MPQIRVEHVTKRYKEEKRFQYALQDFSLTIDQGEFVFLIGSSGAGKSTLLQIIGNEISPDKGCVYLDERNISMMVGPLRAFAARNFGIVHQQSTFIRKRTIEENLFIAAQSAGMRRQSIHPAIKKVLGLVGLSGVEKKFPVELSIGECRRIELARALINSPPILLIDELTANLDDDVIWDLMHLLTEINERGTTVIMATHASQYVNILRRRVVTLVDGRLAGDVKKGKYGSLV